MEYSITIVDGNGKEWHYIVTGDMQVPADDPEAAAQAVADGRAWEPM